MLTINKSKDNQDLNLSNKAPSKKDQKDNSKIRSILVFNNSKCKGLIYSKITM